MQGVGGRVKASGFGTIKVRIIDDENNLNDLLIHNVIYLPKSPINLISPQKWSLGSKTQQEQERSQLVLQHYYFGTTL